MLLPVDIASHEWWDTTHKATLEYHILAFKSRIVKESYV